MNLDIHISKFIVLEYVILVLYLFFYGTKGVISYMALARAFVTIKLN